MRLEVNEWRTKWGCNEPSGTELFLTSPRLVNLTEQICTAAHMPYFHVFSGHDDWYHFISFPISTLWIPPFWDGQFNVWRPHFLDQKAKWEMVYLQALHHVAFPLKITNGFESFWICDQMGSGEFTTDQYFEHVCWKHWLEPQLDDGHWCLAVGPKV